MSNNSSDTITRGLRVVVHPFYLPEKSLPRHHQWVFGYRVTITNEGDRPAQVLGRHWIIIDGEGKREDVKGPGVVGDTPLIEPGGTFSYVSFCPLGTPWGTMEGAYEVVFDDEERADIAIGRFYLNPASVTVPPAPEPV